MLFVCAVRVPTATTAQVGFAKRVDQFSVRPTGPQGVDARIEFRGGLHATVAQHLPDQFVGTRIAIKDKFCAQMPELMRCDLHTQMPQNRFVDCDGNVCLTFWLADARNEQPVWLAADNGGRDLVAINLQTVGQKSRQLGT